MSGVKVIRTLLAADASVTAVVPSARIRAGDLPLNTAMPAISISQISSTPYNLIRSNESNKFWTDRVQITVYRRDDDSGDGYPGLRPLLDLIISACASQRGTVASVAVDSIRPMGEGPDLPIPSLSLVTRSIDFQVKFTR